MNTTAWGTSAYGAQPGYGQQSGYATSYDNAYQSNPYATAYQDPTQYAGYGSLLQRQQNKAAQLPSRADYISRQMLERYQPQNSGLQSANTMQYDSGYRMWQPTGEEGQGYWNRFSGSGYNPFSYSTGNYATQFGRGWGSDAMFGGKPMTSPWYKSMMYGGMNSYNRARQQENMLAMLSNRY